jgi:hypothetical protein
MTTVDDVSALDRAVVGMEWLGRKLGWRGLAAELLLVALLLGWGLSR